VRPETLQLLKDERADLARQLMTLDSAIEILAGVPNTGFAVSPALQAAVMRAKPAKPADGPKPRKPRGLVGNKVSRDNQAAMCAAIERAGETFQAEELTEKFGLKLDPRRVAKNLNNYAVRGWVETVQKGKPCWPAIYRRGLGWSKFAARFAGKSDGQKKFHVEQSEEVKSETKPKRKALSPRPSPPEPVERRGGFQTLPRTAGKRGVSPQVTALEGLFKGLSGTYTATAIIEMVRRDSPELVATASKESDLRVRLFDMATAGHIRRTGTGSAAQYSAIRPVKLVPVDEELNIRVPRDPDVAGGGK